MARVKSNGLPWPLVNKKIVGRGGGAPGSYASGRDEASINHEIEGGIGKAAKAINANLNKRVAMEEMERLKAIAMRKERERGRSKSK